MKRMWVGIGFLLVIFAVGCCLSVAFDRVHRPLSRDLEEASRCALEGDWETAGTLTEKAEGEWKKLRGLTAAAADHEPMEEVDALFAQLQAPLQERDGTVFAVLCIRLASLCDAMADSQAVHWWSLL